MAASAKGAIVAGLRAAGGVDLVCAFMNTRDDGVDHLADPEAFGVWLSDHVPGDGAVPDKRAVALARRLRVALRRLARANQGEPVDAAAADQLDRLAWQVGLRVGFTGAAEVEVSSAAKGVTGALGAVLGAVAVAMTEGSWQRVKVCGNDECAVAFYDESRNRSGKWCTMAVCGNRVKARTFRQRVQAATPRAAENTRDEK